MGGASEKPELADVAVDVLRDTARLPQRFEPERSVASGGMGVVYLARDRQTSERVAVKVLHKGLEDDARFEREAAMLATLSHDAIVRYIAHGIGADKRPFIAMEWLEGEDLGKRLARGPLTPAQTTTLLKRVSEALAVVHRAGLVHRDIKPDNIFLPDGQLGLAKLVDFGLARPPRARMLTAEGIVVGTPGYMAPEQIRGEVPDARVDVFALGCVAYQCLTGQAPFRGGNAVAVLTKVLIESAAPIAGQCPDAPRPLVALVGRMMAKERNARPPDGQAMLAELGGLDREPVHTRAARLSGAERILAAVLVVAWFSTRFDHYQASIEEIAKQHGARVEAALGHGTIIAFSRTQTAEEQAILATRAALEMARLPGVRASLAIAATEGTLSEAIESAGTAPISWPRGSVLIDDVTDRLLPSRFERVPVGARFAIVAEREGVDLPRLVLGRPTPFVGRKAELGSLIARTESLLGHSQAGVLTVMGEPGIGKSRLRHEALRVIASRASSLTVLAARGDLRLRDVPLGLFTQMLRRAAGVTGNDPTGDRSRLVERIRRVMPTPGRAEHIARFIGEACGVPFGDDDPALNAARRDRALYSEQTRAAISDFIAAEAFRGPLLLIVEDAHDADPASIAMLATLVTRLARSPLAFWLVTRSAVDVGVPSAYSCQLGALTREEAGSLWAAIVGAAPEQVSANAAAIGLGGSPALVEEAARAWLEHGGGERDPRLAADVPAILTARLSALPAPLRDVLRAASVAGSVFWLSLLHELLGDVASVDLACDDLVRREWLVEQPVSRFHGERQLGFRSDAAREAAASLLVSEDRAQGHEMVARFLERMGESDSLTIANHFTAATNLRAAAPHLLRAAEHALVFSDAASAVELAERGLSGAEDRELRGGLLTVMAEARRTLGELAQAAADADRAIEELEGLPRPRSRRWFDAVGEGVILSSRLRRLETLVRLSQALLAEACDEPSGAQVIATARAAMLLEHAGVGVRSAPLYAFLDRVGRRFLDDPLVSGRVVFAHAWRALSSGDYHAYKALLLRAVRCFEKAGDTKTTATMEANAAHACLELGDYAEAVRLAGAALERASASHSRGAMAVAQNNLGMALGRTGKVAEGVAVERLAVETYKKLGDVRLEGASRVYLARLLSLSGALAEAESEAHHGTQLLEAIPLMLSHALATSSTVLLARGRATEALTAAQRANDVLHRAGNCEGSPVPIHLCLFDALVAVGEDADAEDALIRAEQAMNAAASKIADDGARSRFLDNVAEHVRIRRLRRESGANRRNS